jgi:hypothetical protein
MSTRGLPLALALAALALAGLLVVAPPAAAGLPRKHATFKATIVGTQEGKATRGPSDDPDCMAPSGQSTETVQFKSAPFKLKVLYVPVAGELFLGNSKGRAPLTAQATITRLNSGSIACLNDPDRPSDCGTKTISKWKLSLVKKGPAFQEGDRVPVNLGQQDTEDPFRNCRNSGPSFPLILIDENAATLSKGRLFNRRKKKIVVTGKGTQTKGQATSTLTYTLTLRRR